MSGTIKLTIEASLTAEQLAALYCKMDDDAQARFYCECARLMREWGAGKASMQNHYIGRHLATCECSTDDGRTMLREIVSAMEYK